MRLISGVLRPRGRRGVALLIVLGLLALLLISAVAFTILMRIERGGASNLRHGVGARHMLRGALARAISDIDSNHPAAFPNGTRVAIRSQLYPPWTNSVWRIGGARTPDTVIDVPDEVIFSVNPEEANPDYARVLSEEAMTYVPKVFQRAVETAKPEWIPIVVEDRTVGRMAYIAINTSGLLDANVVGASNRWMGAAPGEIQLSPDAQPDVASAVTFKNQRNEAGRYETFPELVDFNGGIKPDVSQSFDVFSRSYGELNPEGKPKINIGGDADSIRKQRDAIKDAFKKCGMTEMQSQYAYLGLVDYVDEDSDPEEEWGLKYDRPCTENVPLFSRFSVSVDYAAVEKVGDPSMYTHTMTYLIEVEFAYPYQSSAKDITLEADVCAIDQGNPNTTWNDLYPPLYGDTFPLSLSGVDCAAGDFKQMQVPLIVKTMDLPKSQGFAEVAFEWFCRARVKVNGEIVRQTPTVDYDDWDKGNANMVNLRVYKRFAGSEKADFWAETIDPRFNWSGQDYAYWRDNQRTLCPTTPPWPAQAAPLSDLAKMAVFQGGPGVPALDAVTLPEAAYGRLATYMLHFPQALSEYFGIVVDGVRDGSDAANCDPLLRQVASYVANRELRSVGELGYLPIDRWFTITLYDHSHSDRHGMLPASGYHPVLDYFTVSDPSVPVRGRVNVNTRSTCVLGAVFLDMPVDVESEATPGTKRIPAKRTTGNVNDCVKLARRLQSKGPFTKVSDIGRIFQWSPVPHLGVYNQSTNPGLDEPAQLLAEIGGATGFGELEREALIRNACELLTTQQQTFLIILRADSFSPRYGMTTIRRGNVLASTHAVAQVWRDASPTPGLANHRCFVQILKTLSD